VTTIQLTRWMRWVFYFAVTAGAAWLLWAGRAIWFPVCLAFVIAMVLDPLVDRLENRGASRTAATGLVFLLFIVGGVTLVFALSPTISEQAGAISRDVSRLFPDPERPDLVQPTARILNGMDTHPVLRKALLQAARQGTTRLSAALAGASEFVVAWAPNLVWFIVVPVLAFYVLNDFHRIYAKGMLLVPPRHRTWAQSLVADITALFGKYVRGLAQVCALLGLCIAGLLFALGHPYWQFLGVLGGVLYAIPVVGSIFNIALASLITLGTAGPGQATIVAVSLLVLTNGLFDQIVTPRVLGKQVGLHPILTIISLLLGYQTAGVGGMLVAVPLAGCVQTVVLHLIPKLGMDLELRPLEELQQAEVETYEAEAAAEERPLDDHFCLQSVVENAEGTERAAA
jgi:predicted PurR-regulated permease PerM